MNRTVDSCLSAPCENNGTCINSVNMFSCQCPAGYFGNNCQSGRKFMCLDGS